MERENRPERPARDNRRRRKVCQFCVDKVACIDFKDTVHPFQGQDNSISFAIRYTAKHCTSIASLGDNRNLIAAAQTHDGGDFLGVGRQDDRQCLAGEPLPDISQIGQQRASIRQNSICSDNLLALFKKSGYLHDHPEK